MRFSRMDRYEFRDTYRKRLAFLRKQQQERDSYPLFADQIAAQQTHVDVEMTERKQILDTQHSKDRALRARKWREARAALAQYPDSERRELLAYWRRCKWPGDPSYLLTMLHMHANGRLDMNPPFVRETEACRQAVRSTIARIHARESARKAVGVNQIQPA